MGALSIPGKRRLWGESVKRLIDITFSIAALLTLSPLVTVLFFAIKIDSAGPAFFLQRRISKDGTVFTIIKFRTMYHSKLNQLIGSGEVGTDGLASSFSRYQVTTPGDSRVTRVGAVLRRVHLDEIPQFVNVILGDMSLVGPRPDVPAQEADYTPRYWKARHKVRPGITGLAQVQATISPRRRLASDIFYVRRNSIIMDFWIMKKTIEKVCRRSSF
jgi:lipopolysaccharide/colanic/teichoic acid biosynthesis glycosyltransferase